MPLLFGAVQGEVGVLFQRHHVSPVVGIHGDANGHGHVEEVALHLHRRGDVAQQLLTQRDRFFRRVELTQVDGEFVPALPGNDVRGPQGAPQPPGQFLQKAVADMVSERVVDLLKMVHVDHEQGAPTLGAEQQIVLHGFFQGSADQQAGQSVVGGGVLQAFLGLAQVLVDGDQGKVLPLFFLGLLPQQFDLEFGFQHLTAALGEPRELARLQFVVDAGMS